MPDKRKHRGRHPEDRKLFSDEELPRLRAAASDLSWMFSRGYAQNSALKLVGDRWELDVRQRHAVKRSSCSDQQRERRQAKLIDAIPDGQRLHLDGFNVLITVEAALSGALILDSRDGAYRDIASMHGTFRVVEETAPAIKLIGQTLKELMIDQCVWYFDRPVSNSGRIAAVVEEIANDCQWNWKTQLEHDPDKVLCACNEPVASSDSWILDQCRLWFNLTRKIVEREVQSAWVIRFNE